MESCPGEARNEPSKMLLKMEKVHVQTFASSTSNTQTVRTLHCFQTCPTPMIGLQSSSKSAQTEGWSLLIPHIEWMTCVINYQTLGTDFMVITEIVTKSSQRIWIVFKATKQAVLERRLHLLVEKVEDPVVRQTSRDKILFHPDCIFCRRKGLKAVKKGSTWTTEGLSTFEKGGGMDS